MIILGVESSCDETAIALVQDGTKVLSSKISSQTTLHARWGGVVPEIAAREHLTALPVLLDAALQDAGCELRDIDAIAVTQGPGLIGCLLVGVSFAKGLAQALQKPLIPINHVHAHVHGAFLGVNQDLQNLFPALALVVSGGHTNLYYLTSALHFELLAHTIDDACGESFDKVGKMLGLPYPGGPHVEALAKLGDPKRVAMPKMLQRRDHLAFSYSGLKTAVAHTLRQPSLTATPADIAASFQEEALGQLARKINESLKLRPDARSLVIAGGVAANKRFKEMLDQSMPLPVYFPPLTYCGDNGAMIAAMAYYEWKQPLASFRHMDWDVYSRYPFETYLVNAHTPR